MKKIKIKYSLICELFKSGEVMEALLLIKEYDIYEFLLDTRKFDCYGQETTGYKLSKLCIEILKEKKND